jgi:hypothetical protein
VHSRLPEPTAAPFTFASRPTLQGPTLGLELFGTQGFQNTSRPTRFPVLSRQDGPCELTVLHLQVGHSVATLAKHYAGTLEELEDKPRTPAADAINAARNQLKCAQSVRSDPTEENWRPAESPATTGVGDTGLEPVTSALSRRRSPS